MPSRDGVAATAAAAAEAIFSIGATRCSAAAATPLLGGGGGLRLPREGGRSAGRVRSGVDAAERELEPEGLELEKVVVLLLPEEGGPNLATGKTNIVMIVAAGGTGSRALLHCSIYNVIWESMNTPIIFYSTEKNILLP